MKRKKPTLELIAARRLLILHKWRQVKRKKKRPAWKPAKFDGRKDYWQMRE